MEDAGDNMLVEGVSVHLRAMNAHRQRKEVEVEMLCMPCSLAVTSAVPRNLGDGMTL